MNISQEKVHGAEPSVTINNRAPTEHDEDMSPLDDLPSGLPPEAIFERFSSGAAAREKLERLASTKLPPFFYFFSGALVGDHRKGPTPMRLTGCEFRAAKSGPRAGRLVIPVPGTEKTVTVTPEEIQAFEKERTAFRLKELRRLRRLRRAQERTSMSSDAHDMGQ